MRRSKPLLVCLIAFLLFASGISLRASDDNKANRDTLRGLRNFSVVVEELKSDTISDGLTRDQLQTDVELRLRKAGIRVLDSDDPEAKGSPFLYVNADLLKLSSVTGLYVFHCHVGLTQSVTVASTGETVFLQTWSVDLIGSVGANAMSMTIRTNVADLVDDFANAYLSVNPKNQR